MIGIIFGIGCFVGAYYVWKYVPNKLIAGAVSVVLIITGLVNVL